jgi:hypothetical protein
MMAENNRSRVVRVLLVISILAIALGGFAFRYKTVNVEDSVFMVERWTGKAAFIYKDGSALSVETRESVRGPLLLPKKTSADVDAQMRLRIKWRSGKIHFALEVQPYTDWMKNARKSKKPHYVIELLDREGFVIKTLWVPVYKMKTNKDAEGTIDSLEYRASSSICSQDFKAIRRWDIR